MTIVDRAVGSQTVGVVIVAYNSAPLLRRGLDRWTDSPGAEVVVVDNGSTDDSVAAARQAGVLTIDVGTNEGYAAACNRGAAELKGRHPWIAFVNPDVELHPADLARLVDGPPAGTVALTPLLVDENGRPLPDLARPEPTLSATVALFLLTARADRAARHMHGRLLNASGRWFPVPVTSGACMVVRSSALADGGFPSGYFLNGEDVEFSIQLRSTGGSILVDRDVPVVHRRNSSSGDVGRTERELEVARATVTLFARLKPKWQLPVVAIAITAGMALRGLRDPLRAPLSRRSWRRWVAGTTILGREALRTVITVWRGGPLPAAPGPLFIGRHLG